VGEQVAHRRGPEAGLGGDQPVGAQVVVGRRIQVDQPLLGQLQHRDRGEGLGDRPDPKHRVLGDGRVRRYVCNPVAVEELEASVADNAHGQPKRRVAVQDAVDPALQFQLVGPEGCRIEVLGLRVGE